MAGGRVCASGYFFSGPGALIQIRLFGTDDRNHARWTLIRLQFQAKLILKCAKQSWIGRIGWNAAAVILSPIELEIEVSAETGAIHDDAIGFRLKR